MNNKLYRKFNKGFTLVELLVATAIIVMVLAVAVTAEVQFLRASTTTKEKMQAVNLAQGALNEVRTIHDNNKLNSRDSYDGLAAGHYCLQKTGSTWGLVGPFSDPTKCTDALKNVTLDITTYTIEITVN